MKKYTLLLTVMLLIPTGFTTVQETLTIEQMIINQWSNNGYPQYAQLAVRIARCESGLNPYAKNRRSSASGVFQLTRTHWSKPRFDPFDPAKNIEKAFYLFRPAKGRVGFDKHWRASKKCWGR